MHPSFCYKCSTRDNGQMILVLIPDLCYVAFSDLLDAMPEKRAFEDGGYISDDGLEV